MKEGSCVRQNNGSQIYPFLNLWNLQIYYLKGQKWLYRCNVKILKWGDYPGLTGCAQCNHRVLISERGRQERQNQRKIMEAEIGVLVLKMERAVNQGMWDAFISCQRQGTISVLEPPKEMQPFGHLDFSTIRPFWNSDL